MAEWSPPALADYGIWCDLRWQYSRPSAGQQNNPRSIENAPASPEAGAMHCVRTWVVLKRG
jgi:hypothetical protein